MKGVRVRRAGRLAVGALACASIAVLAGGALGAIKPTITAASDDQGNTTFNYTQGSADDAPAVFKLFVPFDYIFNFGAQPGDVLGQATVKGSQTLTGSLTQTAATQTFTIGGQSVTQAAAATACTGTAAKAQTWLLTLGSLQVPVYVDGLIDPDPLSLYHQLQLTICAPTPDVLKIQQLTITFQNVFSVPFGWEVWHAVVTPYVSGKADPTGNVSAESQDRQPKALTLTARHDPKRAGSVIVSGKLLYGGKGLAKIPVKIMAGTTAVGTVMTKAGGKFSGSVKTTKTKLVATAAVPDTTLPSCVQPIFPNCVSATVGGLALTSDPATVSK
jgi:hypothetical protein